MSETGKLRSVQFIDNYFPVIDGVTETVHQYACHMDAAVVCPAMERHYLEKHDFPYTLLTAATFRIPFSRYATSAPRFDMKLAGEIAKEEPDIFHFHSPSMLGEYAAALGKKTGVPVVGTFHSKYYDAILEMTRSKMLAKTITQRFIRVYESCDEVWTCSEETGETLRSYGYTKPFFIMPNGTEAKRPENAEELKERAASALKLPKGKRILLFVGQMIWYKNQRLILDSFRLLCDKSNDWFLVMAGGGRDEKDIGRYAASLNLTEEQVMLTGLISDRDLLTGLYLNADLLFFPSVFDNAPLVLREAAVLGVPALLAEGSNAAGVVRKNFSGFTAGTTPGEMAGEIQRIFAEEDLQEIGRNARETIPVSWEQLTAMVQERYRTVIDRYTDERK